MEAATVIQTIEISKHFGEASAIREVSLQVRQGELFALIGKNGAGKSTLLDMLAGEMQPDSGYILVPGLDLMEEPYKLRKVPGASTPSYSVIDRMTVLEALAYVRQCPGPYGRLRDLLDQFDMGEFGDTTVRNLPGGYRQRLYLAIAMADDPDLLLLDEPTTGMGIEAKQQYWCFLDNLRKRGKTIIIASHDMTEIARHCDRLAVLKNGMLKACGSSAELIRELPFYGMTLEAVYMHYAVGPKGGVEV